jgi:hypothetical protein
MPGLNVQLMLATARTRFCSFRLQLPTVTGARPPQLYIAPVSSSVRSLSGRQQPGRGTPQSSPPALFVAASDDTRDIEQQRVCSDAMDTYLTRICDAIAQAHNVWRSQARLVQVVINSVQASAGNLQGGSLAPEIRQRAPRENAWQRPRSEAIATAIGFCWENWQRSVTVPGLPWYPAFAAFPGPLVPPTPNVPSPLVTLMQNPVLLLSSPLKNQMRAHYSGDNEWPNELFDAVASGLETAFRVWTPTQMVTNVMGSGPVPTFAPPYVPVGPVVGGTGTQLPGAWLN